MPLPTSYISNRSITVGKRGRKLNPSAIIHDSFVDPAAAVTNGISASHAGAGAAGTTLQTIGGSLASGGVATLSPARNVVITVTHGSSVVAMSGTITGTDAYGNGMTEAWSVTAGGTTKTFTGKKAFKTVTSITEVVAADASTNTIISGSGTVLGLSAPLAVASAIKEVAAGSVVTNGTFVVASTAATDDPHGTYSPNTAPNGSNDYDVWYISDTPERGR
jgi:hypothetical protein